MNILIKEYKKIGEYGIVNTYSEYLDVKTDRKHLNNKFKVVLTKFKNTYKYFEKIIKDNLTLDEAENFIKQFKED